MLPRPVLPLLITSSSDKLTSAGLVCPDWLATGSVFPRLILPGISLLSPACLARLSRIRYHYMMAGINGDERPCLNRHRNVVSIRREFGGARSNYFNGGATEKTGLRIRIFGLIRPIEWILHGLTWTGMQSTPRVGIRSTVSRHSAPDATSSEHAIARFISPLAARHDQRRRRAHGKEERHRHVVLVDQREGLVRVHRGARHVLEHGDGQVMAAVGAACGEALGVSISLIRFKPHSASARYNRMQSTKYKWQRRPLHAHNRVLGTTYTMAAAGQQDHHLRPFFPSSIKSRELELSRIRPSV